MNLHIVLAERRYWSLPSDDIPVRGMLDAILDICCLYAITGTYGVQMPPGRKRFLQQLADHGYVWFDEGRDLIVPLPKLWEHVTHVQPTDD